METASPSVPGVLRPRHPCCVCNSVRVLGAHTDVQSAFGSWLRLARLESHTSRCVSILTADMRGYSLQISSQEADWMLATLEFWKMSERHYLPATVGANARNRVWLGSDALVACVWHS